MKPPNVYKQVIVVTQDYLGPASERFIDRLISHHLHKKPEELTVGDIPKLAQWIKVSLGVLTDDRSVVDDCEKKILQLKQRAV